MSYTVWIKVESDEDADGWAKWWSVDHFASRREAIEHAEDMCAQHYSRTGVEPQAMDDDAKEEEDDEF
jgi:hypothetical protein